ncbi:MAG: hypothetical protein JW915_21140 [Chitinispirillaceae bacterium]|nr:hypothetical protein [Chitinispirillaceae bacterium]
MHETLFIDKKLIAETESDYDRFFRTGIELLQKYAGENWTDYNIHDPGVTILEQLCYALTELSYKSSFDVVNYFVDKNNEIPFESLGLFRPHKCMPNGCVTINDLRRVLFDDVLEIGNIWIETDNADIKGLLNVYVDIADHLSVTEETKVNVKNQIKKAFAKHRNLCEDISEIIILDREYWELCGEIEVHTIRPIDEVYGEIFYTCVNYVASNLKYHSVMELKTAGMTLPEILNGPALKNGIVLESDLFERSRVIDISEMISKIKKIDGVKEIHSLYIRNNGKEIHEEVPYYQNRKVKAIRIPQDNEEIALKILSKGKWYKANTGIVSDEVYKQLVYDPCFPEYLEDLENLFDYSPGMYRDFNNYYSIQNDFPVSYGISFEGLSANETPDRKAKAKQLKAYLYFFEQVMADYLESIQNIKRLFSVDESLNNTYFSKYLNNRNIPDIEDLYTDNITMPEKLMYTLGKYDDNVSRRSAILDFLLSIYGLEFKQHSLRHYIQSEKDISIEQKIIQNKIRYLKNAARITDRSSNGKNYLDSELKPDNLSGLELQVLLRTGLDPADHNPNDTFFHIEHILLRPVEKKIASDQYEFYQHMVTLVFPGFRGRYSDKEFRMLVMEIVEQYAPAHIYVNSIWCDHKEWTKIESVHAKWCECLIKESDDRDAVSGELVKLIKEMSSKE